MCSLDMSYMECDKIIIVRSFLDVIYALVVYVDHLFVNMLLV